VLRVGATRNFLDTMSGFSKGSLDSLVERGDTLGCLTGDVNVPAEVGARG
jgi:hypothetical protein